MLICFSLSWQAVIRYAQTETEQLQKSKAPVSKGGQREARKQEIRAVFKFVIRTAEKSEEKLDAVDM